MKTFFVVCQTTRRGKVWRHTVIATDKEVALRAFLSETGLTMDDLITSSVREQGQPYVSAWDQDYTL